jgi:hypothetical protein
MTTTWISDLKLEQFVLEELSAGEMANIRTQAGDDEALQIRIEAIHLDNERFVQDKSSEQFFAQVQARAGRQVSEPERAFWTRPMAWGPGLAAAMLLLFFVNSPPENDAGYRMKGIEPHLLAHRIQGSVAELLVAGEKASAGERIQLSVVGAEGLHAVVLSIDGGGLVTLHYPQEGETTFWPGPSVSLPRSYELDDAPSFERFFLITGSDAIDVDAVFRMAQEFANREDAEEAMFESIQDELQSSSILIEKVE